MVDIRSVESILCNRNLPWPDRILKVWSHLHEAGWQPIKEKIEARSTVGKLQSDFVLYGENQDNGVFFRKSPDERLCNREILQSGTSFSRKVARPLFSMADLSTVWVVANVYAGNLQFVHEGNALKLHPWPIQQSFSRVR